MKKPVPASYAQVTYHAEHAFRFTAANGTSRFGRYRFVPLAGEAFIAPDEGGKRAPSFLHDELDGDATALWPDDRPLVELGRLEITGISPTSAADERRLIFAPPTGRTASISPPIRFCWRARRRTRSLTSGAPRRREDTGGKAALADLSASRALARGCGTPG